MTSTRSAEKILYLDFDGVRHDEEVYFHPRRGIYMATACRVLFEWMPILDELLAPHPTVAIVLSTSWVRTFSFYYAKKQLSPLLQDRVIGATFHRQHMRQDSFVGLPRGEQIASDVARRGPKSWFAIDDDNVNWPVWCRGNLIKTEGHSGISAPEIQGAIRRMLEGL